MRWLSCCNGTKGITNCYLWPSRHPRCFLKWRFLKLGPHPPVTSTFHLHTSYFLLRTSHFVHLTSYFYLRASCFLPLVSCFLLPCLLLPCLLLLPSFFLLPSSFLLLSSPVAILAQSHVGFKPFWLKALHPNICLAPQCAPFG